MTAPGARPPALDAAGAVRATLAALAKDPDASSEAHRASDVDGSPRSLHHTLGPLAGQAAAGDHRHAAGDLTGDADELAGIPRTWRGQAVGNVTLITTEAKDTSLGDVTFTAVAGREYHFRYSATVQPVGGPAAMDVRVRIIDVTATPGLSPGIADQQVAGAAVGQTATFGGSAATTVIAEQTRSCPGDLAAGTWKAAGFAIRTSAGAGSTSIALVQPTGAARQLEITERIPG